MLHPRRLIPSVSRIAGPVDQAVDHVSVPTERWSLAGALVKQNEYADMCTASQCQAQACWCCRSGLGVIPNPGRSRAGQPRLAGWGLR